MNAPARRRELGRRLADLRKAAGYTQQQLAAAAGYSRSAVSNAEIGHPEVARAFWASCDRVLKAGRTLTLAFDQLRTAERRQAAGLPETAPDSGVQAFRRARQKITSADPGEALAGYLDLGWSVAPGDGYLELATGVQVDALELPGTAGRLAVSLWLYSQGRPDVIRQLPTLPRPAHALAAIAAGDRYYFLADAGGSPWRGQPPPAAPGTDQPTAVIHWHADGSHIPLPPSPAPGRQHATWVHLPSRPMRLAPPIGLLGLLGLAAAMTAGDPPGLTLPGGTRVIPAPARPAQP